MNRVIADMLQRYELSSASGYTDALKEIIQEITLLGLARSKFFEKALFYGGTALRILHTLDRFSEDLDFCLREPDASFSLEPFHAAVQRELQAFGFEVEIKQKRKGAESAVRSAFLRANTREHVLRVGAPPVIQKQFQAEELIKIKMEVDSDPAPGALLSSVELLDPVPFNVCTLTLPSLFAGKMHALLCRKWGRRIKGRDWYDFLWYIRRRVPVNLAYLEAKMRQTGHYENASPLNRELLLELLTAKVEGLDIDNAKLDVLPFVRDAAMLDGWTARAFLVAADRIDVLPSG